MDAKREQEWKDQAQSRFPKFAYGEIAGAVFEAAYARIEYAPPCKEQTYYDRLEVISIQVIKLTVRYTSSS